MKHFTRILIVALAGATLLAAAEPPVSKAAGAFAKLKSLAGEWEGKTQDGKPARMSWEAVSEGTRIMQVDRTEHNMVTMYYLDRDRLMMTHYCAANNQPRMRAEPSADLKSLAFSFVDATNLAGPGDGHMHRMVLTFQDKDRVTEEWTWNKGSEEHVEKFTFQRKK